MQQSESIKKITQLLIAHNALYFGFGKPSDDYLVNLAKTLHDQNYPAQKLDFALTSISNNAGKNFPTINEIKISGLAYKPPRSTMKDPIDEIREESRKKFEIAFEKIYTELGHEDFINAYGLYLRDVLDFDKSSISNASEQLMKTKIELKNSLFVMLMIRDYMLAKGDLGKMVTIGRRDKL